MTEREFELQRKTKIRNALKLYKRGMTRLMKDFRAFLRFAALTVAVLVTAVVLWSEQAEALPHVKFLRVLVGTEYTLFVLAAINIIICIFGAVPHAREIRDNLERVGFVNAAHEVPEPIGYYAPLGGMIEITFRTVGMTPEMWIDKKKAIESALNLIVFEVVNGNGLDEVIVYGKRPKQALPKRAVWSQQLKDGEYTLTLGVSQMGQVVIDLIKTPHWLIAATTGMGKTQLILLIIEQLMCHGAEIIIADWKRGVDFSLRIRKRCRFVCDYDELIAELQRVKGIIVDRADRYNAVMGVRGENVACNNTRIYERLTGEKLKHIVFIFDETSMILDAAGRKGEKEMIAEVISRVNEIGRIGRAYGVHLIVSTQRPDVASVPGSIKANLDGRICGHVADNTSSIVILDHGDAAKLPAIPGRFIIRDCGVEQVFQAYILPDDN